MHHYFQGKPTRQAHKGIPEGLFEEEQGTKGFYGPVSHLLRKEPATNWIEIEGPLKPRMYDLVPLKTQKGLKRLLYNAHMSLYYLTLGLDEEPKESFTAQRNADGDLLYFCHEGQGDVFTDYGWLAYHPGQYLMVPKCLTHWLRPQTPSHFLLIENRSSHYEEPDRGPLGKNAFYDSQALVLPQLEKQQKLLSEQQIEVKRVQIKHLDETTLFKYPQTIFDVVGWKGDLYPYTLNMKDIMPVMSHRAHLPPSAHTTFVAKDFVVCTFLPRPLESDADALKVPFYHQNIDYDEVLFYHDGDFFSRDHLHPGMMSFHPAGFAHGPHPKAVQTIADKKETRENAVMIDSRWPLYRDEGIKSLEQENYWRSWIKS